MTTTTAWNASSTKSWVSRRTPCTLSRCAYLWSVSDCQTPTMCSSRPSVVAIALRRQASPSFAGFSSSSKSRASATRTATGITLLRYGTDKLPCLVKEVVDRRRSTGMLGNYLMHGHVVGRATGRDQSNATTLLLLLIAKHPCRILGLVLCRESRRRSGRHGHETHHDACEVVRIGQDASVVVLLNLIL